MKPGERAGAICSMNDGNLVLFGYGTYKGDLIPEGDNLQGMPALLKENKVPNPRIDLDSGETVYGCECWWGPEDKVKVYEKAAKTVLTLKVSQYRKSE